MFCCTICRVNALGIDMEEIFATPCGHVFHKKCIEFCLLKYVISIYCDYSMLKCHIQCLIWGGGTWRDKVTIFFFQYFSVPILNKNPWSILYRSSIDTKIQTFFFLFSCVTLLFYFPNQALVS